MTPAIFIYVAVVGVLIFIVFSLVKARALPALAEMTELMLSLAAAGSGIALCRDIISGEKSLGAYADQTLTIWLGGFVVFWVSLLSVIKLVKGVLARARVKDSSQGATATG